MADLDERSRTVVEVIIKECLRKLQVLGWCTKNEQLCDTSGTYSIARLLENRSHGLHAVLNEIRSHSIDNFSGSLDVVSSLDDGEIKFDSSCSGEERLYYDRFEYVSRSKELARLRNGLRIVKFKCHEQNQKLHLESQNAMLKHRFVQYWEASRKEQLRHTIDLQAEQVGNELALKRRDKTQALRATTAIEEYYNWKLADIELQIEGWMNRFDSEKEVQDSRFQKARATEKQWNELRDIYEHQEREIERLQKELTRWTPAETNYPSQANKSGTEQQ
ncbi:uncharacterized protein LOC128269783 [Anopheles cruzii]|uniref:uncharacterized protein LOC128269783 n=1 Tax=Anopheles cruzii TaxID=68878 RepID=UPI0022EC310C|nr:uncharacterized protein LOC128269783 [Anopheles cruzii]